MGRVGPKVADQGIQACLCEPLRKGTQRPREADSSGLHFLHRKYEDLLKAEHLNPWLRS